MMLDGSLRGCTMTINELRQVIQIQEREMAKMKPNVLAFAERQCAKNRARMKREAMRQKQQEFNA